MAVHNPSRYGKIAILTSAIIFLGTPHQFQSLDHLEDQLLELILLRGPDIKKNVISKVKNLTHQVDNINQSFVTTKILDHAAIFNIFSQNSYDSQIQKPISNDIANATEPGSTDDLANPVTPFPQYAHHIGQSFEAAGRISLNTTAHTDLVRGDPRNKWLSRVSNMFNLRGSPFIIKINYNTIKFQAWVISLMPPTRAMDIFYDPMLPESPVVTWIYKQATYFSFSTPGAGLRLLHLHGNGDSSVNVSELSRLFYVNYDYKSTHALSTDLPHKTMVYFEFDQWDSRYTNVSSLLTYLINVLVRQFSTNPRDKAVAELTLLNNICSWSREDLFHIYTTLRVYYPSARKLTLFIGCFDQCPKDQRQWLLRHILEEGRYSDAENRLIISTSTLDDLAVESFPNESRINLADCPVINESSKWLKTELQSRMDSLIAQRQIYKDFRAQLVDLLEECRDAPHLGHIILTWLGNYHRGRSRSEITDKINKLSPAIPENIVQVFISSMSPRLQSKAKNVFNWVKHAFEPWSPESLAEALVVYEIQDEEPLLDDLDRKGMMSEIEMAFSGIIIFQNRDIKFSHPSFYNVPEVGIERNTVEWASQVNGTIAETCLRYFQLRVAREMLKGFYLENFEGGPWTTQLDAAVVSHRRVSMAEYAVRFWHQHYKASGRFKPSKLVHKLFDIKESRAAWELPFWLLTNPFTRMQRSYISTLPVLAMLGLEDMVEEKVKSEKGQPLFHKNCWLAITEAARARNKDIVQQLLSLVMVDEEELQTALYWAATDRNTAIVDTLLESITNIRTFQLTENTLLRASVAGLDNLFATLLKPGYDINKISIPWKARLGICMARRKRLSTLEILLKSLATSPDLTVNKLAGDLILTAIIKGDPALIELLLRYGACSEATNEDSIELLRTAVAWCRYKAIDILIKAGVDANGCKLEDNTKSYTRPPLVIAADWGLLECCRVLLNHNADPKIGYPTGSALYKAVAGNHEDVARLLLEHEPKLIDMEVTPSGQDMLLIRAVCIGNTELVFLLIKYNAKTNFVDPNGYLPNNIRCMTPLSRACFEGDLEMVKLLIENNADINYTGGKSDPPLFTSLCNNRIEVAKYLLQKVNVDVQWTSDDGRGALHMAFNMPDIIPKILQKGASIDSHSSQGTTLHMASRCGFPKSIKKLLENDSKPDVDYVYRDDGIFKDEIGCTPLQLACKHHKPECLKVLLIAGANPKYKNKSGDDAVDILLRTERDKKEACECLKLLLTKPYSVPVNQVNEQSQTRLHKIRGKTPVSVIQLLIEAKAPLDVQDKYGYTPLAIATVKGNMSVVKYLIEQGANVNVFGPRFGSILHIAVTRGPLDLIKLLIDSGADLKKVDFQYGESLLYTALGIKDDTKLRKTVRYLVDEARVPIDNFGGELAYPIIRAAYMTQTNRATGIKMLKFLIRRKAQLDVADSQGLRAVHYVCTLRCDDGIKALVEAGADIDAEDKFGRKPIHFAVSTPSNDDCINLLLDRSKTTDIVNVADHDNWTPLLWAARSGDDRTITKLIARGADVWVRGRTFDGEWTALKLMNFADRNTSVKSELEPKERARINKKNEKEIWDDKFHTTKPGYKKNAVCRSCLVVSITPFFH
ncbi:putative ankyrin repeat protein [Camillea tinctor]|nr:putative ankyrin repeat protein [Camillea tinctor]